MTSQTHPFANAPLARRMLEISPAAVAIINHQSVIVFANQKFNALFGYLEDDLVGQPAQQVFPGACLCDRASREVRRLSQTVTADNAPSTSRIGKTKEGMDFPVTYSMHEVVGLPEPLYLLNLFHADQDLLDGDLLEANRLAAIAQMVGGLAHESRNALQRAVACLDLLELDLKNNPEHLELSTQIRNSLCDLVDSYEEVRRYAQPIQLQRQRVGLLNLCQIAFNELAVEQDDFPHQLQIHMPGDESDWLAVDRDRMRLVFRHLLENAIHAADGPARIEVDCQRVDSPPNAWLVVRIRDHGGGFSQQALNHAFEPFFTTKQRGTGLGLAICRRILAAHDGKIAIRCPPDGERPSGVGSSVEICLPVPPPTANGSFTH